MQNLYDILGVSRTASNKDINAALRQLVRRYNEESAKGTIDSGEALKFVNRARLTFANQERRTKYDVELANFEAEIAKEQAAAEQAAAEANVTTGTPELPADMERPATSTSDNLPEIDLDLDLGFGKAEQADVPNAPQREAPPERPSKTRAAAKRPAAPKPERSSILLNTDSVLTPIPLDQKSGEMAFMGSAMPDPNMVRDLGSVFSQGEAKTRSTTPDPGLRFAARLVDYGLWGILITAILTVLKNGGILPEQTFGILMNPLVAPILITLTWAPIEGVLLIYFPKTPGKAALDVRVDLNVSNPYAANDPGELLRASFSRAFLVWWRGLGAGFFPIYFFTILRARKQLMKSKETSWDFDNDCLVTHGKVDISTSVVVVLLVGGVVALYSTYWVAPLWQTVESGMRYAKGGASTAQDALKILKRGTPTHSKEIPPPPQKDSHTVMLEKSAQELIEKRDWKNLSEQCLQWTKEDDRNATAWFCYGRALHELGEYGAALTALKRAALLDPSNDDIRRFIKDASLRDMQQKQLRKRQGLE